MPIETALYLQPLDTLGGVVEFRMTAQMNSFKNAKCKVQNEKFKVWFFRC